MTAGAGPRGGNTEEVDDGAIGRRFETLASIWREDVATVSSSTVMAAHPAYRQVVGMGRDALPHIFADMRRAPDHWFAALREITGEDPVQASDRGRVAAMSEAWLRWADENGYAEREST